MKRLGIQDIRPTLGGKMKDQNIASVNIAKGQLLLIGRKKIWSGLWSGRSTMLVATKKKNTRKREDKKKEREIHLSSQSILLLGKSLHFSRPCRGAS